LDQETTGHVIFVCTRCRDPQTGERMGEGLIATLRDLIDQSSANGALRAYAVQGIACMAGCERPLTVGFQAGGKASYLFGDIDARVNVEDLLIFAQTYRDLPDGWCNASQRPAGLDNKTLARVPRTPVGRR